MKNLTGALVFSLSLLFTSGCHKNTGESPDRTDPLATERADSGTSGAAPGDKPEGRGAMGGAATREVCVDRWLQTQKLDRFGHPEGTMYAGGTPLFNEATGESRDRLEYIFERHPDAKAACANTDAGATGH